MKHSTCSYTNMSPWLSDTCNYFVKQTHSCCTHGIRTKLMLLSIKAPLCTTTFVLLNMCTCKITLGLPSKHCDHYADTLLPRVGRQLIVTHGRPRLYIYIYMSVTLWATGGSTLNIPLTRPSYCLYENRRNLPRANGGLPFVQRPTMARRQPSTASDDAILQFRMLPG